MSFQDRKDGPATLRYRLKKKSKIRIKITIIARKYCAIIYPKFDRYATRVVFNRNYFIFK